MLAGTGFVFVGETIVFVCAGNWKTTYPRKSGKNLQLDRRPQSLEGAAGNCTDKLLVFDVLEPGVSTVSVVQRPLSDHSPRDLNIHPQGLHAAFKHPELQHCRWLQSGEIIWGGRVSGQTKPRSVQGLRQVDGRLAESGQQGAPMAVGTEI